MARIIWVISPDDDTKLNYTPQAFCFNDSNLWLAYGREINYSMLRQNLRDLVRTYDIRKITIQPIEACEKVSYYIRYAKGESRLPRMLITSPVETKQMQPAYGELKPIHKRALFGDPSVFDEPETNVIPRKIQKNQNREKILVAARNLKVDLEFDKWKKINCLIPIAKIGRPPSNDRKTVNALRWMLLTGGLWNDIPKRYGPYKTVYNRFSRWKADGTIYKIFQEMDMDPSPLLVKRYY